MNVKMLIGAILITGGCVFFAPKKQSLPKYRKICFHLVMPSFMPYGNGNVDIRPVTVNIIDGGNCMLYELTHWETFHENGVLQKDTTYYDLFAFQKGKPYGYMLKSLLDTFGKRLSVDSIIQARAFHIRDAAKEIKNVTLGEVVQINESQFIRRYKVDDIDYDSAYYYYDRRLNNIPYSLSPTFDSLYKSKLYKVETVIKKANRLHDNTGKDYNISSLSLGIAPVENVQALDTFFARFKKETL